MKTVQDLRNLITENGGNLVIGEISFNINDSGDVDIRAVGKLLAWYRAEVDGETLLSEKNCMSVMSGYTLIEKINEPEVVSVKPQEEAVDTEKFVAIGKVEAYEKLLIGRDVTISK